MLDHPNKRTQISETEEQVKKVMNELKTALNINTTSKTSINPLVENYCPNILKQLKELYPNDTFEHVQKLLQIDADKTVEDLANVKPRRKLNEEEIKKYSQPSEESIEKPVDVRNFISSSKKMVADCIALMGKKSHDYASNQNRYSNFEYAAQAAGIKPEQAILSLIGIKVARLTQLVSAGKTPENESVEDTMKDLINYTLILSGYLQGLQ